MNKRKKIKLRNIILLLLMFSIGISIFKQRLLMKQLDTKKAGLQSEVEILEEEVKYLKREIEVSDTIEFTEKVAREELGMVKPREIIYKDKNKENLKKKPINPVNDWQSLSSTIY